MNEEMQTIVTEMASSVVYACVIQRALELCSFGGRWYRPGCGRPKPRPSPRNGIMVWLVETMTSEPDSTACKDLCNVLVHIIVVSAYKHSAQAKAGPLAL